MKNRFYTREVKLKAVEMRLAGIPVKDIMEELDIKNESQVYIWYYWHRDGEVHRMDQEEPFWKLMVCNIRYRKWINIISW